MNPSSRSKENYLSSPNFNFKPYCFGPEMLQEFLFSLAETNNDLVKNYHLLSVRKYLN